MMDTKTMTAFLGLLLLAACPAVAADEDDGRTRVQVPGSDCSVADVMQYEPYVDLRPWCLPPPLGGAVGQAVGES